MTAFERALQERRTVVVVDAPAEDLPVELREGAARRAIAATTGRCPCGGRVRCLGPIRPGTVTRAVAEHEPHCPAVDGRLDKWPA